MKTKDLSVDCYRYFSDKEGNQHIAGLYALEKILDIIEVNQPKRILEIGLGIGSIAYTIMKHAEILALNISYDGTESNEFCLNELRKNLLCYYENINIYNSLSELEIIDKYDFVIIDGADKSLSKVKDIISTHGVIFIEGDRALQRKKIKGLFPNHKYACCISDFKNPNFGPFPSNNWSSGGHIIYVNPNTNQLSHFIRERLKTSFRYKVKRKLYPEGIKI